MRLSIIGAAGRQPGLELTNEYPLFAQPSMDLDHGGISGGVSFTIRFPDVAIVVTRGIDELGTILWSGQQQPNLVLHATNESSIDKQAYKDSSSLRARTAA